MKSFTKSWMKNQQSVRVGLFTLAVFAFASHPAQAAKSSPEEEAVQVARSLKPISDDAWKEIAGARIEGQYDITPGDTLYDVSKRLFGDGRYWPKVWAMNNNSILNPHLIRPGNHVVFTPGTGVSLPAVSVKTASADDVSEKASDAGKTIVTSPKRHSNEWMRLPAQTWEASSIAAEQAARQDFKVMGSLDKVHTLSPTRELSMWATSEPIEMLGEIDSSPSMTTYLKIGDQVFIKANGDSIKIGETYSITHEPYALESDSKKRQGYAYHVDGEVRILSTHDQVFLGVITQTRSFVQRGAKLTAAIPRIKDMDPIAAPAVQDGIFYVNMGVSTFIAGQYQFGFVNLGSEDGLQTGMILESYENKDQNTGMNLALTDFFHVADMQVVQVSERFSTVRIISGSSEIYDQMPVHLLTDVSQLKSFGPNPGRSTDVDTGTMENPAPVPTPSATPSVTPSPSPSQAPSPAPSPSPSPSPVPAPVVSALPSATPVPSDVPPPPPLPPPVEAEKPKKNELDSLDGEDHLAPNEKRELEQLEKYQSKDPAESLPSPAATTPAPSAPASSTETPASGAAPATGAASASSASVSPEAPLPPPPLETAPLSPPVENALPPSSSEVQEF